MDKPLIPEGAEAKVEANTDGDRVYEFTVVVKAKKSKDCQELLDATSMAFLGAVGSYGGNPWECVEDYVMLDPSWVPGVGPKGEARGWKGYRKFQNRAETVSGNAEEERSSSHDSQ